MPSGQRVALADIPALTFYKDAVTLARRTSPIPQLTCIGKPCKLYTPEVVRCQNLGGQGSEVDWKCEADLPESLRFGRVEVSCEGWSGPGDPHVLKGSCGLEYRLVQIPSSLRNEDSYSTRGAFQRWIQSTDVARMAFLAIWMAFLVFILYSMLKSCLRGSSSTRGRPQPGSGSGGSSWFPGSDNDSSDHPPPPYSKNATPDVPQSQTWRPGFWTGAAIGGLGTALLNRGRGAGRTDSRPWDWEQERNRVPRRTAFRDDDRGEGSSSLGAMRTSTGLGGSNVR
ncbi:hypothetical protein PLICRDRAFT_159249 [Plicaturopsis crispa FD-325 SS-3]|nr:hypothetical protein PLICRDRAFT_159249 [Plicaturopsis crispa FD-325 SS-3]